MGDDELERVLKIFKKTIFKKIIATEITESSEIFISQCPQCPALVGSVAPEFLVVAMPR